MVRGNLERDAPNFNGHLTFFAGVSGAEAARILRISVRRQNFSKFSFTRSGGRRAGWGWGDGPGAGWVQGTRKCNFYGHGSV